MKQKYINSVYNNISKCALVVTWTMHDTRRVTGLLILVVSKKYLIYILPVCNLQVLLDQFHLHYKDFHLSPWFQCTWLLHGEDNGKYGDPHYQIPVYQQHHKILHNIQCTSIAMATARLKFLPSQQYSMFIFFIHYC